MKKLFLGSIALTLFSISLTLIQFSCGDKVNAKPATGQQQQGKILFTINFGISGGAIPELWVANFDGTNAIKVPLTNIPSDLTDYTSSSISPDGQTIFIMGYDNVSNNKTLVYSMTINGNNVKKVIDYTPSSGGSPTSIQAY